MNPPNVLDAPHVTEPTAAEMLRKARDKYVPATDAYMRAFLSELENKMDRGEKVEFVKPRHSGMTAYRTLSGRTGPG